MQILEIQIDSACKIKANSISSNHVFSFVIIRKLCANDRQTILSFPSESVRNTENIGIYMQIFLDKKEDCIPLVSLKTPRVPF